MHYVKHTEKSLPMISVSFGVNLYKHTFLCAIDIYYIIQFSLCSYDIHPWPVVFSCIEIQNWKSIIEKSIGSDTIRMHSRCSIHLVVPFSRSHFRTISTWYICWLQLGWHPVAVLQYTFTYNEYIEQHNEIECTEQNIHNDTFKENMMNRRYLKLIQARGKES
jgi:hypothetical protein